MYFATLATLATLFLAPGGSSIIIEGAKGEKGPSVRDMIRRIQANWVLPPASLQGTRVSISSDLIRPSKQFMTCLTN